MLPGSYQLHCVTILRARFSFLYFSAEKALCGSFKPGEVPGVAAWKNWQMQLSPVCPCQAARTGAGGH